MFDEFAIKRRGQALWEVHIKNGDSTKDTIINHSECALYLDKATELVEDLASKYYHAIRKEME